MQYPYHPDDMTVPFSGVNAPGNSLTAGGPTQEPFGSGKVMQDKKNQMALMMMGQQMKKMGGQGVSMSPMHEPPQLDIYGQPIQGA